MNYILMNESHVEQIADLEKQCFSDPWSANSILSELRNDLSLWIVAIDGERVVGYVGSQSVMGWSDMMNLAVSEEYRRQGIAEKLVNALISALRDRNNTCLTLEVRVSNLPAISLYEKMGFVCVGKRSNYYRNPKEDALILRKEWQL